MNLKLKQSQSPAKTIPPKNMTGYMKTHINMYFRSLYIVYFGYESTVKTDLKLLECEVWKHKTAINLSNVLM